MARRQWRILMVDSDGDYATSLKPFLETELGEVLWAESETQAQTILAKERIDLVLLETILAEPDSGLRWCRKLKAEGQFASVPVFMLSCVDERFGLGLKNKLDEKGYCPAEGFLDKSTQPGEIVATLEKYLRSRA